MSKTTKIINLPKEGELGLMVEKELYKLPTEATHNHFHNLSEQADKVQEQMRSVSLVALIFCALELEHIKNGTQAKSAAPKKGTKKQPLPESGCLEKKVTWRDWVTSNCDFTYETARRYDKVLKCGRAGLIDNLDPEMIPDKAPSLMSKDELQDSCTALAEALQGLGTRRQLYLNLEIIKTPQRKTIMENRNNNGSAKNGTAVEKTLTKEELEKKIEVDRQDAIAAVPRILKPIDDFLAKDRHGLLPKTHLQELDQALQNARDILKPHIK